MTSSNHTWSRNTTQFSSSELEDWMTILSAPFTLSSVADQIPIELGLERRLEIVWMALVMPLLVNNPKETEAPFLQNIAYLSRIYEHDIDLLSHDVYSNMDQEDATHLFPSTVDPAVYADFMAQYEHLMQFKREHPSLLQHLQEKNTFEALMTHATLWGEDLPPFQVLSILPFVESVLISGHHSFEQDLTGETIDALTAHTIWSSGMLDGLLEDNEALNDTEDTLAENFIDGVGTALAALSDHYNLLPGLLIRTLHHHHFKGNNAPRLWIWGHTGR